MAALSSDEDELGFHDMTTTPFRVEKFTDATLKATKPNGRAAVAGPSSSKPASARRAPWKRSPSPVDGDEETEHANVSDEGGTEVMEVPAPAPKRGRPKRGASREPEAAPPPKPKAAPRGKGKGKAKQEAARGASPEVMDIDDLDAIREHVEDEPQEVLRPNVLPRNPRNERASAGDVATWKRREERFLKKIERSEKQAQDAKAQRDALAAQLEEVFHTRNTEAEDLFEQQKSLYESRIQTQEEMIQEQTSQLARVDSLTREGKTSTLHFLTREAADEERRGIERQAEKLKETIKEKEKVIAERESTINDQEVEIRTLKIELAAEVERSKFLASSARPNGRDPPKARALAGSTNGRLEGVKATSTLRLYEDMTNILIFDCKCEPSDDGDEQWVYSCLYSQSDSKQSLSFALRTYVEYGEDGQRVEKVAYTPQQMSDDSAESMEKLDFLAEEFTFHRKQLDVFLNRLYQAMSGAFGISENGE